MSIAELAKYEEEERSATEVSSAPFPPLQNLPPQRPEAPELPPELLPPVFRHWLTDITERMQVSLEMAATPALVALSSVVGRKLGIRPKAKDDWLVVPNMWGGIIARPGKLKSPILTETLQPLRRLAEEERRNFETSMDMRGAELESLKAKETAIKDQLRTAHKGNSKLSPEDLENDLCRLRQEIRENESAAVERRYIVNDSTVEKLGELLKANPQGLLLERDELAGWLRNLERQDRRGDREFFLEAWNGINPFTYDRIGRGTISIPALCLSIIGGIQPTKLSRFVSEALDGGYAADGLLQRFQLLVWPEDARGWELVDRAPNLEARQEVFQLFQSLSKLPSPTDGQDIPALRFSPDAQELFYDWITNLEFRLNSEELLQTPAFESHLSKYRSLMPSLSLLFHLTETEHIESPVSLTAAKLSADWCEFLEQHARKVYAVELEAGRESAHALARKIREGAIASGMTTRDIYNQGWSHLKTSEAVLQGAAVLKECGWARLETLKTSGRPTNVIAINPEIVEGVR